MIDLAARLLERASSSLQDAGPEDEIAHRRAASACYYAVYHALARAFADALLGSEIEKRPNSAWVEVYRGLDHGHCATACDLALSAGVPFPDGLVDVIGAFRTLQDARQMADYDPMPFRGTSAAQYVKTAQECVAAIRKQEDNDIRAFAAWVLISTKGAKNARTSKFATVSQDKSGRKKQRTERKRSRKR